MNWVQHGPNSYQIRLMGPLGGGTVLIEQTRQQLSHSRMDLKNQLPTMQMNYY